MCTCTVCCSEEHVKMEDAVQDIISSCAHCAPVRLSLLSASIHVHSFISLFPKTTHSFHHVSFYRSRRALRAVSFSSRRAGRRKGLRVRDWRHRRRFCQGRRAVRHCPASLSRNPLNLKKRNFLLTNEKRLKTWLSDSTPRVILIDKTFNYKGSEGTVSEKGCRMKSGCNASNGGQDTIGKDKCDANENTVDVKYDKAAKTQLTVGSNKSIVGVGSKGVIQGKGLKIPKGSKNIIIQNVHITVSL